LPKLSVDAIIFLKILENSVILTRVGCNPFGTLPHNCKVLFIYLFLFYLKDRENPIADPKSAHTK
jgi:hypothetical protein